MNSELAVYRAVSYCERAVAMSYAVPYALHQAADMYQVPAGELAELLLAKHVECARARAERDAMAAHDAAVENTGALELRRKPDLAELARQLRAEHGRRRAAD